MGTILLIAIPTVIQAERDVAIAQAAASKESNDVNLKITVCKLQESHSKQLFAAARGSANTPREMFS